MFGTVLLFLMLVNMAAAMNNSEMGHRFQYGQLNLPDAEYLEGCNFDPLCDNFNHISRARRVIENTFGILVARWRLYCTPIIVSIENAESYVLATLALHNYLRLTDIATYTPKGFVDSENSTGNVTAGKWHKNADAYGLVNLPNIRGSRYSEDLYQ